MTVAPLPVTSTSAYRFLQFSLSQANRLEILRQAQGVLPAPYTDDPEGYAERLNWEREQIAEWSQVYRDARQAEEEDKAQFKVAA